MNTNANMNANRNGNCRLPYYIAIVVALFRAVFRVRRSPVTVLICLLIFADMHRAERVSFACCSVGFNSSTVDSANDVAAREVQS